VQRRCDDDEDQWQLKLGVSVEESERELGNEGKRCGVFRGLELTFYRGRWSVGEAAMGGNRRR
jgi:hypothetical protein